MDNNFEFIQTVFIALLFIYIDVLIEILFDSLHFLFNILRNFTPSDVKWLFVRAVIAIVVGNPGNLLYSFTLERATQGECTVHII